MANKGASSGQQRGLFTLALAGLGLATIIAVSLSEPLLTISNKNHGKLYVYVSVHFYLFFLVPLTFYLNMLLLLQNVTQLGAPQAPLPVFLNKHLPRAASVVSLANLLLTAPLLIHMSVAEGTFNFAIEAASAVLALVCIFVSAFKKFLMSYCHAGRDFMPAFFALCISTGSIISFDPMLLFSNNNHYDDFLSPLIPIHLVLPVLSFLAFLLSTALALICIGTSTGRSHNGIHAQKLVIAALSMAIAASLVGWYMKACMSVTGMGSVPV